MKLTIVFLVAAADEALSTLAFCSEVKNFVLSHRKGRQACI